MIGFSAGRFLAVKIFSTHAGSSALEARPYTVSVGTATTFPSLRKADANAKTSLKASSESVFKHCVSKIKTGTVSEEAAHHDPKTLNH